MFYINGNGGPIPIMYGGLMIHGLVPGQRLFASILKLNIRPPLSACEDK